VRFGELAAATIDCAVAIDRFFSTSADWAAAKLGAPSKVAVAARSNWRMVKDIAKCHLDEVVIVDEKNVHAAPVVGGSY